MIIKDIGYFCFGLFPIFGTLENMFITVWYDDVRVCHPPLSGWGGYIALKNVQLLYLKNSQSKLALIYSHPFVSIYGNI